jgi:dissimilatory sulfite reductase (desulfoviridin) alpha/beta subunit
LFPGRLTQARTAPVSAAGCTFPLAAADTQGAHMLTASVNSVAPRNCMHCQTCWNFCESIWFRTPTQSARRSLTGRLGPVPGATLV